MAEEEGFMQGEHMQNFQGFPPIRGGHSGNGHMFMTPYATAFDYDAYYSYGSEINTASANYRPGNSNTQLRRPNRKLSNSKSGNQKPPKSGQKGKIPQVKPLKNSAQSKLMSPNDDSFKVSPMQEARFSDGSDEASKKPKPSEKESGRARAASGTEGNTLLSGASEFDKLQQSDKEDEPKKNLAEEFDLIASKYPDELPAKEDAGSDKDGAAPSQRDDSPQPTEPQRNI